MVPVHTNDKPDGPPFLDFLRERFKFIKRFCNDASFPFEEQQRKIDAGEEPFIPVHTNNEADADESPFFTEWLQAEESLEVLGQACISMLADSLKLYLKERIEELRGLYPQRLAEIGHPGDNKTAFKQGWINGYEVFFEEKLKIPWKDAPTNPEFLDEIALTRNRAQHREHSYDLTGMLEQSPADFVKHPHPFFADEIEMQVLENSDSPEEGLAVFTPWRLKITKKKLFFAVDQVEHFSTWLEDQCRSWCPS
jgi:CDP-glycerol glycerophosphotransferase (TagB/SpsB family)